MMKYLLTAVLIASSVPAVTQETNATMVTTEPLIGVHDPVLIKEGVIYYTFGTGMGISVYSSADMKNWKVQPPVFSKAPSWAVAAVPGFMGHIWAPDISYHHGKYYLYYAVSAFGKNTSCIGVATNKTLDASSKDFKWTDHGKLLQSVPGRDMWNAIDPNLFIDNDNTPWLCFGSFWNGIKLVKLDTSLLTIANPEIWHTIAARPRNAIIPDSVAGDAAIEAPFICLHSNYYYLFVSFDYCCLGEKSTYKMVTGRSDRVTGPYADRDGIPLNLGGGTILLKGNKNWHGVGHNAVASIGDSDYLIFHGYDAKDDGKSKLIIKKLAWLNDWPVVRWNTNGN